MMRKTMAAMLMLGMLAGAARAAEEAPRTISTTGEAVVYVMPDQVTITVGVATFNANLSEATAANEKAAAAMVKAVKAAGVEEPNIGTDNLQVQISYKERNSARGNYEIDGYLVQRNYSVKLKDTKLFEKVVQAALKNGANQLQGVAFETTDLRKYRDQARQMATKAAKEKAVAITRELGVKVGRPRTVSEGASNWSFAGYNGNAFNNNAQVVMQGPAGGGGGGDEESLPLGQMAVRASISVVFELAD